MNMMSMQDEREESALPYSGIDLPNAGFDQVDDLDEIRAPKTSLLERIAWFRDLSLRGKVNTVFGIFFGIGFAMSMILGLGLSELWLRYSASERMNVAVYEAVELRSVAGDLRYQSMLYLFVADENILERQREGYEGARGRLETIEKIAADSMPELLPAVRRTTSELSAYNDAFTTVITAQSQGADEERVTTLARRLASRGESVIKETRELADSFALLRENSRHSEAKYFGYMIAILIALASLATAILFMGLRYLSYDFSAKIEEITQGMTRLANGDREFAIAGHDRKDEIGRLRATPEIRAEHPAGQNGDQIDTQFLSQ